MWVSYQENLEVIFHVLFLKSKLNEISICAHKTAHATTKISAEGGGKQTLLLAGQVWGDTI